MVYNNKKKIIFALHLKIKKLFQVKVKKKNLNKVKYF